MTRVRQMVCLDATSGQLMANTRPPLPALPTRPARRDPLNVPGGVANLVLVTEPLRDRRAVTVSGQRTRLDVAACVKELVDVFYLEAETIGRVLDQLTIHSPASRYAACPPAEAQGLADTLVIQTTSKHGWWSNMAELGLNVLHRQGMRQRLPDRAAMAREVGTLASRRNDQTKRIDWQFITAAARIKLRWLYPTSDR